MEKRSKKVDWGEKVVEKSGLRWKSGLKKWTEVEKLSKKVDWGGQVPNNNKENKYLC